jgi:hypothetical protein
MGPRACSLQSDRIRAQFKLFAYRLAGPRAIGPQAVPSGAILL